MSGTTLRVGSGNAGALRLVLLFALLFSFEFVFAFPFTDGVKSSLGPGEAPTLALGLAFTFAAGGVIAPPDGIPASPFPVAGCAG